MEDKRNWSIRDIESITEEEAKAMSLETMVLKEHDIYFADLGDTFGYSCLVFKDHHHIYYADDYRLHHRSIDTIEGLRQGYIKKMNSILFTEAEIAEPLKDHEEYRRKSHYLHNYYNTFQLTIHLRY